jgi:hypothetical protein
MTDATLTGERKPRIAIMGEFSAGKSTLCNLLLKARPLPEKVTATQLSPVWISKGPGTHARVTLDGEIEPVALEHLHDVPIDETAYIKLFMDADILEHCDFIDFPGISDPNMDPEVRQRVLVEADAVIWLTHATQAWRQTEAAVWEEMVPEEVRRNSVLLATRFDKLLTKDDRERVLARLHKEAGPEFEKIFPISLVEALAGVDDYDLWQSSGAEDFLEHMVTLITRLASGEPAPEKSAETAEVIQLDPGAQRPVGPARPAPEPEAPPAPKVVPRRIRPTGVSRRTRPGGLGIHSA